MSDHIPDATKMISDTPRTDAEEYESQDEPITKLGSVDAEFARTLERHFNAANSKIELLMSANADVARIADERDAAEKRVRLLIAERDTARGYADQKWKLRQEFHDLFGTDDISEAVALVRELKDRIKRLEEAGDALFENSNPSRWDSPAAAARKLTEQSNWIKAKEAKP
jgi:hypothetical protein